MQFNAPEKKTTKNQLQQKTQKKRVSEVLME
jgi:hypothetical protein